VAADTALVLVGVALLEHGAADGVAGICDKSAVQPGSLGSACVAATMAAVPLSVVVVALAMLTAVAGTGLCAAFL